MDMNSLLVWWLLAVPIAVAVVDRIMMGGSTSSGTAVADGYIARYNGGTSGASTPL